MPGGPEETLQDGRAVTVRPLRADDAAAIHKSDVGGVAVGITTPQAAADRGHRVRLTG